MTRDPFLPHLFAARKAAYPAKPDKPAAKRSEDFELWRELRDYYRAAGLWRPAALAERQFNRLVERRARQAVQKR